MTRGVLEKIVVLDSVHFMPEDAMERGPRPVGDMRGSYASTPHPIADEPESPL